MPPGKGTHVRTRIPSCTYTFKWSVEHFEKFLPDKTLTSSDFHPVSSNRWYSTLERSSSSVTWTMVNSNGENVHVHHSVSIIDSNGKMLHKKSLQKIYNRHNTRCSLIDISDQTLMTKLMETKNGIVTFICFMSLTGNDVTTESFEIKSDEVDQTENLKKLSSDLKTMYGVSLYTDVCLRVDDTILRAHKAILCARSPVFAKMFEHKMDERETNMIDVGDLEADALKGLVSYLYTGIVPNEDLESLFTLYYAADKYDVADLRKTCGDMLFAKIEVDNACRILTLADRHCDDSLKTFVLTFMDIYLESIMDTDGWSHVVNNETKLAAEVMNVRAVNKRNRKEATTVEDAEEYESNICYTPVSKSVFSSRK